MTTILPNASTDSQPPAAGWQIELAAVICERCDRSFLIPAGAAEQDLQRCPMCLTGTLTLLPADSRAARFAYSPELAAPFELSAPALDAALARFAGQIPYPPADLTPEALRRRANRIFLPMWLLDAQAQAEWRAEAGFDYEVVSHRDQYSGAGWASQQVNEGRVRWEPRLGRLERPYANIPAPALEDHRRLSEQLGSYNLQAAKPYQPAALQGCLVRLPERSPQDAWSDARPALQAAAAEECREACRADHIRQFSWQPQFSAENWTLLLLPMLSTSYLDDDQAPQPVWINAQTGQVSGKRRASQKRAARAAGMWLAAAVLIFALSLALAVASALLPPLLPLSVIGFAAAVITGLCATIPLFRVWSFNHSQAPS